MEQATFAAGCFWHVEEVFRQLNGVLNTQVGFMGGKMKNPTYKYVCSGQTGHAEVVHLEFDSKIITYKELIKIFFSIHDPTQKNKQGSDEGTQYRSAIFYHNDKQKSIAWALKKEEQKKYQKPIETEIVKATAFYKAEEYHQKYLMNKGEKTCRI